MGLFERHLSLWVALSIVAGVLLGGSFPDASATLAALDVAWTNLPIAVLIWGRIIPILLVVDFPAIR